MRFIIIFLVILTLSFSFVFADELNTSLKVGNTGQYAGTAQGSATVQGGNVTQMNITSDLSTTQWAGFYGNISTSLRLGDGASILYNFGSTNPLAVFASPGGDLDFSSLNVLDTAPEKTAYDIDFGFTAADSDSISNAFNSVASCNAGTLIGSSYGITPYNSTGSASAWSVCAAQDAGAALDDTVFGTNIIDAGSDAFNGNNVQYQLMVPVNAGADIYYFYLEI